MPAAVIDHREFDTREDYDRCVIAKLRAADVELVVMAGFMRILSPEFFRAFPRRIMNIHPALLPAFPGTHVQKKAVEYGVKFSGCTVHFADEGVDTGPIIIQSVVPVYEDDTADTLSARILKEEHRIYPQAIQYYAEGRIEIKGRKVLIRNGRRLDGESAPQSSSYAVLASIRLSSDQLFYSHCILWFGQHVRYDHHRSGFKFIDCRPRIIPPWTENDSCYRGKSGNGASRRRICLSDRSDAPFGFW